MHGRHETLLDSESFLQEDMNHWSKAVGGAAGVGNDAVLGDVKFIVVHAHHDGDVLVLGRCGDDDLLGAGSDVPLGLLALGKESRGLDDNIDIEIFPRKSSRPLLHGKALDLVTVYHEHVILSNFG